MTISHGDGATSTQVGWLLTNQVDAVDWPLTANQYSLVNCSGSTTIECSHPVADQGYFEIEFNLANVFWGIPMQYGNGTAGIQLRQGIAHLINKQAFAAGNSACAGIVCVPNDDPLPPCSVSSCPNGGLVNPNPCGWDTLFPEVSSTNCTVGAPGGQPTTVPTPPPVQREQSQALLLLSHGRPRSAARTFAPQPSISSRPSRILA